MGNIIEDKTVVSESSHIYLNLKQISGSVNSRSDKWKKNPVVRKR